MHTILKETQLDNTGVTIEPGVFVLFDFATHKMISQKIIPFDLTFYKDYSSFTSNKSPLLLRVNDVYINSFKQLLDNTFDPLSLDGKVTSAMVSSFLKKNFGEFGYIDNVFEDVDEYANIVLDAVIFQLENTRVLKGLEITNTTQNEYKLKITTDDVNTILQTFTIGASTTVIIDTFLVNSFTTNKNIIISLNEAAYGSPLFQNIDVNILRDANFSIAVKTTLK